MEEELTWLKRRQDIITRAVAEMEHQEANSIVPEILDNDVPGSLTWAREELARIEVRIRELSDKLRTQNRPG